MNARTALLFFALSVQLAASACAGDCSPKSVTVSAAAYAAALAGDTDGGVTMVDGGLSSGDASGTGSLGYVACQKLCSASVSSCPITRVVGGSVTLSCELQCD